MGEGVLGHIVKGPVHKKVDTVINSKNGAGQYDKRAQFLTDLRNANTADDYLTNLRSKYGVTPGEANYLRATWYNEGPQGFWAWLQPIYPILRQGLIKSIEEAGEELPLDSYWSPAGNQVEVIVTRSVQQVTRLILTPGTPPPTQNRPTKVPMWIVRRGSGQQQVGDVTFDEVVVAVAGQTITCQVKEP